MKNSMLLLPLFMALSVSVMAKVDVKESKPGLLKQAKVSPEKALKTALKSVKGAALKEAEIEVEGGKLIYSFDLTSSPSGGAWEANVDAKTGKLIKSYQESAVDIAKEKAEDAKEKKSGSDASKK